MISLNYLCCVTLFLFRFYINDIKADEIHKNACIKEDRIQANFDCNSKIKYLKSTFINLIECIYLTDL